MLANSGELNANQKREFKAYMTGFARGKHSLSREEAYGEALRHAWEDRVDFNDRSFKEVMTLVNSTAFELMEDRT